MLIHVMAVNSDQLRRINPCDSCRNFHFWVTYPFNSVNKPPSKYPNLKHKNTDQSYLSNWCIHHKTRQTVLCKSMRILHVYFFFY